MCHSLVCVEADVTAAIMVVYRVSRHHRTATLVVHHVSPVHRLLRGLPSGTMRLCDSIAVGIDTHAVAGNA